MPIYPYVCTACGHEFDALQKISEDPLIDCPECGESTLRKRLAAPSFQLKGTGWYETDFKNKGKQSGKGNGQDKSADKKDGGGESKADSKTDSKPESGKSADKGSSSSASKPATPAKDD